jgi:plastocyanin
MCYGHYILMATQRQTRTTTSALVAAGVFAFVLLGSFLSTGALTRGNARGVIVQDQSGTVVGKVELRAGAQLIRRERGARYRTNESVQDADHQVEKVSEQKSVVVYLEGEKLEAVQSTKPSRIAIDQRNAVFSPHVLAIQKGTSVDFINHDKIYHNVFSLSPAKKFDIGRRPTGEAVPILFDRPGVVQVFCDIHSQMTAYVVVLDNPFFVHPDNDGTFKIDHVPPGTYTLRVWHERLTASDQKITVSPGGTVTAHLVLE